MKEYIQDNIKFDIECTYIVKAVAVILMMVHHLFYVHLDFVKSMV